MKTRSYWKIFLFSLFLLSCASRGNITDTDLLENITKTVAPMPKPMQISRTKGPGAIIPTSTNEMVVTKIVGTEEQSNVAPLPPQPQEIIFHTPDGETLTGYYYPGSKNPSPLIVLMHWALGDKEDWVEIAYWLQNRGLGGSILHDENKAWLDSSWFPQISKDVSYAVFTFTFRGCDGGCKTSLRDKWLMDVEAAMNAAFNLEGIEKNSIVTIGASIGSDGAVDGCYIINEQVPHTCRGALSLSPGSYLTVPYDIAVEHLEEDGYPKAVWCFYSVDDKPSALACKTASGDRYQLFEYKGERHGMMLIDPHVKPNVLDLFLQFLKITLEK